MCPVPQRQRDCGGVHRWGWPSLFWDTRLQGRQSQQQLSHCRNSGGIADLWIVVGNFNSLFTCDFFSYSQSSLKFHRCRLLVAFGPFLAVSGSEEVCGLVLRGNRDRVRCILLLKIFVVTFKIKFYLNFT